MALDGALRRCPLLAVLALRRTGRLAIAAWLYSVPGLRCNPSGQNHIHFPQFITCGYLAVAANVSVLHSFGESTNARSLNDSPAGGSVTLS
jgi:hypothetical protein